MEWALPILELLVVFEDDAVSMMLNFDHLQSRYVRVGFYGNYHNKQKKAIILSFVSFF